MIRPLGLVLLFLSPLVAQAQSTRTLVEEMGLRVERLEQIVQGQALLEMLQRIETLSALSREQRGEIELLTRELETLREQHRAVTVDQERRLAALEREWAERRVERVTAVAAESASAETTEASPSVSTETSAVETPEVLYARALASLNAADYPASIAAFEVFLQQHATHALTDNARYWIGQAYFLLRDYARALEYFEKVSGEIADLGKAADTWLKRGLCELELERLDAARQSFETVSSRYPDSAAAPLARQALGRMGDAASGSESP